MQKRASGGSRGSMHNRNNVPARGALSDPQTYGMLLWQSKLQEKLLQEQKEKRQKELEVQKKRAKESVEHESNPVTTEAREQHPSSLPLEIPQMIVGPAPYTIKPSTPRTPISPEVLQQQQTRPSASPYDSMQNGATTSSGADQQPLFPNISSRMRSSVSCDNFGKLPPPPAMLGSIVSLQQMGGAGSPRRSPSGKLLTALRGDPEIRYHQKDTRGFDQTIRYLMDRDKVLEYKRDLDQQLEEKRRWKSRMGSVAIKEITWKGFMENGDDNGEPATSASGYVFQNRTDKSISGSSGKTGIELAPLMRKFNSLPKLNALNSTDVTRPYVHSPRNEFFHPIQPNEVSETLSSQLREKAWLARNLQENERIATQRHFETWNSLWGRPGAGAPISFAEKSMGHGVSFGNLAGSSSNEVGGYHHNSNTGYNKVNLFKALHMSYQQPSKPK